MFNLFCILGLLRELFGGLELPENWALNVLKFMNWSQEKGTTGKVEPCKKFLEEEKFTFQRKISNVILDHGIPSALILILDQNPLSYVSSGQLGSIHFQQRGQRISRLKGLMIKGKLQRLF